MIHYHGADINGFDQPVFALSGKHAIISFAYPSKLEVVAELCQSFILDNGAYSGWTKGDPFDMPGFLNFVSRWHRHPGFDWYVMPDVIDGSDDDNAAMRAAWLKVAGSEIWRKGVPVWHLNESLRTLETMVNGFDRVAIGSAGAFAQIGTTAWWNRMAEAMSVACDRDGFPKARLHGLRMLDPTIFSHFPFASADSSNVARNSGDDQRWTGPYAPKSKRMRALLMIDRIEAHASASRWAGSGVGAAQNLELFG